MTGIKRRKFLQTLAAAPIVGKIVKEVVAGSTPLPEPAKVEAHNMETGDGSSVSCSMSPEYEYLFTCDYYHKSRDEDKD